jgi:Tol biopolymer transport system component
MNRIIGITIGAIAIIIVGGAAGAGGSGTSGKSSLHKSLKALPAKIAWECYVNGNWEIFVMNADGSRQVNLTKTPDQNEHYPQISPDCTKIAFTADSGEGRDTVRSLWVMDINGKHRKKIADRAREQFWAPDSKSLGYLPQEYPKFDVIDYSTKGMSFYNLETGKTTPHPNSAKLHHLYNPCFAPNGKWIASTVHAGMGYDHAILLIEAHGDKIINLKIPGCRPCISPDGKQIAWGSGDHELDAAPIDLDSDNPIVGTWSFHIKDEHYKIYHIDWSPDCKYIAFSRGPEGEGDLTKKGTFQAACEIVGVHAQGWNICAVPFKHGTIDLEKATDVDYVQLTTNGASNKEPAWFRPGH